MLNQVFATKQKMTQAWTKSGKRVAVTCLHVGPNAVVGQKQVDGQATKRLEIGFGDKKLKNMTKPLRSKLEKGGFSFGVAGIREVKVPTESEIKTGDVVRVEHVLQVGDVVSVQGVTKGRGFAGAIKRHGFSGGPKTHGQSDRWRAVGAIGQRTTPGRVFRNKRMPGHYGQEVQTVTGLVVLHVDPTAQQLWLSGPVPGAMETVVKIEKTGATKSIEIDQKASGVPIVPEAVVAEAEVVANEATEEKVVEAEVTPGVEVTEPATEEGDK